MADFKTAHKVVMANEGGYANSPHDTGGETYKGIARKKHPNWPGWKIVDSARFDKSFPDNLDRNEILQMLVLDFFKEEFWDVLSLDQISDQSVATELYDTGVNMGVGIAALFLQTALNVSNRNGADYPDLKEDAVIGLKTVSAMNHHKRPADVLKVLNVLQGARYIDIMKHNPSQEIFFRSWFSRVAI